jgi:hypothetical protein
MPTSPRPVIPEAGDHDCREPQVSRGEPALHLQPVDFRHVHVKDQTARLQGRRHVEKRFGAGKARHLVCRAQLTFQHPPHLLVVVDDVDLRDRIHRQHPNRRAQGCRFTSFRRTPERSGSGRPAEDQALTAAASML